MHRDLKPANIKVREDGTVKVLDFGLAKALDATIGSGEADPMNSPTLTARSTQLGMILGTAAYMSPEQAKGRPVDKRADIWAFGAVLYEMLTGRRAFAGEAVSETLASVLRQDVDWSALPAEPLPRALAARALSRARPQTPPARYRRCPVRSGPREAAGPSGVTPARPCRVCSDARPNRQLLPWAAGLVIAAARWPGARAGRLPCPRRSSPCTESHESELDLAYSLSAMDGTRLTYSIVGGQDRPRWACATRRCVRGKPVSEAVAPFR